MDQQTRQETYHQRFVREFAERKLGPSVEPFKAAVRKALTLASDSEHGQAISFVLQELRYDRWKRLGTLSEFEYLLEGTGFKLTKISHKTGNGGYRTYVSEVK